MFAFVDETGNTGANILDENQPLFVTAAFLTRSDFDIRFGREFETILMKLGQKEIHANKIGLGGLEEISGELLGIIRKAGPAFALARVEKRYVLASKVFDTLFDPYENKSVAPHLYNVRVLRLLLVFKVASLLDDHAGQRFWDALHMARETDAREAMSTFCAEMAARSDMLPDKWSLAIVKDAFDWAAVNPESLEFVESSRAGRKGHSPNMVGFGNLLSSIEQQSNDWRRPVQVIRHDRQNEFAQSLRFWHEIYSNAKDDVITLPLGEKMVLRKVFGSELQIVAAIDSPGVQIADVILWLFNRVLRGDDLPPGSKKIMQYVFSRAYEDDFSFVGVGNVLRKLLAEVGARDVTHAQLQEAERIRSQIEEHRQDRIREYASAKNLDM